MAKMGLDLGKFRKIHSDEHTTTLKHMRDQHEIKLAHKALSPDMRQNLDAIPMAEGGWANPKTQKNAEDISKGVNTPGSLSEMTSGIKQGLGQLFGSTAPQSKAEGGNVDPDFPQDPRQVVDPSAVQSTQSDGPDFLKYLRPGSALPPGPQQSIEAQPPSAPQQQQQEEMIPQRSDGAITQSAPIAGNDPFSQSWEGQLKGLGEQKAGAVMQAKAQSELGSQEAQANRDYHADLANKQIKYEDARNDILQERQQMQKDYAEGKIDPKAYWNSLSTGKQISTGLGLILGGMGAGLTHGPNIVFQYLQNNIDRDIDSQKQNLGKKNSLLAHNYQQMGDLNQAEQMTRLQSADMMSAHLKELAGTAQSTSAKGTLLGVAGMYDQKSAELQHQIAIQKMQMGGTNGPDPARLVPMLVPQEHQKQAFAEIEAAEDTKKMSQSILKSFEDAAKENTAMRTGAGFLRTPGSVYALHQSMQPTFKDLEGTVRQAAMDNTFKNITPSPGDSDHTIKQKRAALNNYLQSKLSAPTARAYGIDLGKFGSTSPIQQQQFKIVGGVKYMRGPNGEAVPVK